MNSIRYISALHVTILALMVFRITRLIIVDTLLEPVRTWIFNRKNPDTTVFGYLFTCEWCMSMWIAIPVVICYDRFPDTTFLVGCIFALSAIAGLITARLDQ